MSAHWLSCHPQHTARWQRCLHKLRGRICIWARWPFAGPSHNRNKLVSPRHDTHRRWICFAQKSAVWYGPCPGHTVYIPGHDLRRKKIQSTPRSKPIKLSVYDMITESITIQRLHIFSLALTPVEWWEVDRRPFNTDSAAETWLKSYGNWKLED